MVTKGIWTNTGRTHFKKGQIAWNKKEPIKKVCKCGKMFSVPPSLDRVKSCSYSCARKGKPTWNKGLKAESDLRVKLNTQRGGLTKRGRPFKHSGQFKKGHVPWNFKSDNVSYGTLHDRINYRRGPAKNHKCTDCGNQAQDWSNIDGKYGTDVFKNFQPRCRSCHRKYDYFLRKRAMV